MSMEAGYSQGAQTACTCTNNALHRNTFADLGYETKYTLEDYNPSKDIKTDLSEMHGEHAAHLMVKGMP